MGGRRQARELALQLLYQHEFRSAPAEEMQANFEGWQGASESVREFADELFRGVVRSAVEIDSVLEQFSSNWRLERLATVDRNILRLAVFELLFRTDTPAAVIINEAIEVAKKFGAEESGRFVNGVLDAFVKSRTPAP